jgi:hypothetical protein
MAHYTPLSQKEFLLKFARDRECWFGWLFEAKRRYVLCVMCYVLCVLNYVVTSEVVRIFRTTPLGVIFHDIRPLLAA